MSKLFEQIYRKTKKIYYHGSPFTFENVELRNHYEGTRPAIFLSTDKSFAGGYALHALREMHKKDRTLKFAPRIYLCRLTRDNLNICNLSSKRDMHDIVEKLEAFKNHDPEWDSEEHMDEFGYTLHEPGYEGTLDWFAESLAYADTKRNWQIMENHRVMEIMTELGYDGFATEEWDGENLAVFDNIVKTLDSEALIFEGQDCVGTERDPKYRPERLYMPVYGEVHDLPEGVTI